MSEFMIVRGDPLEKRRRRVRVISWGSIVLLALIIVGFFALRAMDRIGDDAAWIVGILTFVTLALSIICGFRDLAHYGERDMVFVLTDEGIERKWKGQPDRKFKFSEIDSIGEELSWLIIRRNHPQAKIAIPKMVRGYEVLCAELQKHFPFDTSASFPAKSVTLLATSIACWAAVLLLHDLKGIVATGSVALITLVVGSRHMWRLQHHEQQRAFLYISLGVAWLTALLLIYFKIAQL